MGMIALVAQLLVVGLFLLHSKYGYETRTSGGEKNFSNMAVFQGDIYVARQQEALYKLSTDGKWSKITDLQKDLLDIKLFPTSKTLFLVARREERSLGRSSEHLELYQLTESGLRKIDTPNYFNDKGSPEEVYAAGNDLFFSNCNFSDRENGWSWTRLNDVTGCRGKPSCRPLYYNGIWYIASEENGLTTMVPQPEKEVESKDVHLDFKIIVPFHGKLYAVNEDEETQWIYKFDETSGWAPTEWSMKHEVCGLTATEANIYFSTCNGEIFKVVNEQPVLVLKLGNMDMEELSIRMDTLFVYKGVLYLDGSSLYAIHGKELKLVKFEGDDISLSFGDYHIFGGELFAKLEANYERELKYNGVRWKEIYGDVRFDLDGSPCIEKYEGIGDERDSVVLCADKKYTSKKSGDTHSLCGQNGGKGNTECTPSYYGLQGLMDDPIQGHLISSDNEQIHYVDRGCGAHVFSSVTGVLIRTSPLPLLRYIQNSSSCKSIVMNRQLYAVSDNGIVYNLQGDSWVRVMAKEEDIVPPPRSPIFYTVGDELYVLSAVDDAARQLLFKFEGDRWAPFLDMGEGFAIAEVVGDDKTLFIKDKIGLKIMTVDNTGTITPFSTTEKDPIRSILYKDGLLYVVFKKAGVFVMEDPETGELKRVGDAINP